MKTADSVRHPYRKLARGLMLRGAGMTLVAVAAVLLFRSLTIGRLADGIVSFMQRAFSMDYYEAVDMYRFLIPNYMEEIIGITILLLMGCLFGMLLRSFIRYFDQVVCGIERLSQREGGEIALSPELDYIQDRLNSVRRTLDAQEQEQKRTEQEKNDMIVYLAHDIRTPLTSVLGYLSLLDECPGLPEEEREKYIKIALTKAERLEVLVQEFFELTRYEFQNIPLSKERLPLRYMLEQLTDELYPQMSVCGKRLDNLVDAETMVFGDGDKLARVFNNLLKNAAIYGDEGCVIRVSAEETQNSTIIRFENGGTIPAGQLEAIFDKFCRLDSARTENAGGAGLGLTIARDIVRLHGGTISASCSDGMTVFTVVLPKA